MALELIVLQTNRKFVPGMWGIIPVWFYPVAEASYFPGVGVYSGRCIRKIEPYRQNPNCFLYANTVFTSKMLILNYFPFLSSHDGKNKSA